MSPTPAPDVDIDIDARGLLCPEPVMQLARAARSLGSGVIAVLADDPAADADIPAWCGMRSAVLVRREPMTDGVRYVVRVGADPVSDEPDE